MATAKFYDISAVLNDLERADGRLERRDILKTIYRLQDAMGSDGVMNDTVSVLPWLVEYFQARQRLTGVCLALGGVWLAFMALAFAYHYFSA